MWNYHHRRCRHVIVPFRYPFSGQVQVQQQLSQEEYAAMQERENAIAQLEVSDAERELRAQEDLEMRQLENDITTMAEVFSEVQKLVTDQGEVVGT